MTARYRVIPVMVCTWPTPTWLDVDEKNICRAFQISSTLLTSRQLSVSHFASSEVLHVRTITSQVARWSRSVWALYSRTQFYFDDYFLLYISGAKLICLQLAFAEFVQVVYNILHPLICSFLHTPLCSSLNACSKAQLINMVQPSESVSKTMSIESV